MSRGRMAGWSAWRLAVATVLFTAMSVAIPMPKETAAELGALGPLWVTWYLGFPVVGAMIVTRRPDNVIGWILCLIGAGLGFGVLADGYARYALQVSAAPLPAGRLAAWVSTLVFAPAIGLVPFLVLLFPDGRLPSPAWRLPARLAASVIALFALGEAVDPGPMRSIPEAVNPVGIEALVRVWEPVSSALGHALALFAFAVFIDALWRLRRSRSEERQQLKWLVYAIALFPVLFVPAVVYDWVAPNALGEAAFVLPFVVAGNGVAAAIGVAVVKYRLYEIDRVVSRTVSYTALTGVLGAVYAAGVVLLGTLLRAESELAVAGSTLAVAAVFGPARRRIQAAVDRRFNRTRYDAEQTVAVLRARLLDEVDLVQLTSELLAAVHHTVQPARASLWLRNRDADGSAL